MNANPSQPINPNMKRKANPRVEQIIENNKIRKLEKNLTSLSRKNNCIAFERNFTDNFPSFQKNLDKLLPNLTTEEKKMAMFIKSRISNNDIEFINHTTKDRILILKHKLMEKLEIRDWKDAEHIFYCL